MKKTRIYISAVIALLTSAVLISCTSNGENGGLDANKTPIVTVNGETLYLEDLDMVIPHSLSGEDSTNAANEYIKLWINELLIYDKAKKNIVNTQTINEMVEDYRKSLITNSYRERILKEHFSKSISNENLRSFFEQNKSMFNLDAPVIKGLYLKIPINSPQLSNFKKWYTQETDDAKSKIENNSLQNVVGYEYFYDKWVSLPEVMNNIPYATSDYEGFLKNRKYLEVEDSSYVYLLKIKEYKLAGTEAPYEYVKDHLPETYKEKNRTSFLQQIQQDLYNKAMSDKKIKFYKD